MTTPGHGVPSPPPAGAGNRLGSGPAAIAAAPNREQLAHSRVLVVGDARLDRYWFGAVDRISPEAPVPVVRVSREEERLGGAANVALNVKTLGAQATLLTVVGDDEPARKLRVAAEQRSDALLLEQAAQPTWR